MLFQRWKVSDKSLVYILYKRFVSVSCTDVMNDLTSSVLLQLICGFVMIKECDNAEGCLLCALPWHSTRW